VFLGVKGVFALEKVRDEFLQRRGGTLPKKLGGGGGGREAKSTLGIRHSDVFILHLAKREVIAIFFCLYNALITVLKHFYFLKLCSQKNYS